MEKAETLRSSILEALNRRYAVKKFNPAEKLDAGEVEVLTEAARLAPSSYGLQPYEIFVITDPEIRKRLADQPQVRHASHLFVFAAYEKINRDYIEKYLRRAADIRGFPEEQVQRRTDQIFADVSSKSESKMREWTACQTYICLGQVLTAAAMAGIDTCPMEGFNREACAGFFDMKAKGLRPLVLMAAGRKSEDDQAQFNEKVRRPKDELIKFDPVKQK